MDRAGQGVAARSSPTTAGRASPGRRSTAAAAAPATQAAIFAEECGPRRRAVGRVRRRASSMAGPTIIAHGTDEQKAALPAADAARRRGVVPAVQRAGRRAPTSPACRPGPCATATSGSSTGRRCGRRARTTATGASCWPAPTPTSRSTAASRTSWSTCARRASRSARCARSPAPRTSTRCSSPTCASRTTNVVGERRTAAGASR